MALSLGWTPEASISSFWRADSSVDWAATPEADQKSYEQDGDGSHLKLRPGADPPTEFRVRALQVDERAAVQRLSLIAGLEQVGPVDSVSAEMLSLASARGSWWAMRIGVTVAKDDVLAMYDTAKRLHGERFEAPRVAVERVYGFDCLPKWFMRGLANLYGWEIVEFYGGLVWRASVLSDGEKKTSSPGPTPKERPSAAASASESETLASGANGAAPTSVPGLIQPAPLADESPTAP